MSELWKKWPDRFYAVKHERGREEDAVWTISSSPEEEGWKTDSGQYGYGLPREIAERIVEVLNSPILWHFGLK